MESVIWFGLGTVLGAVLVVVLRKLSPDATTAHIKHLTAQLAQAHAEVAHHSGLSQRLDAEREAFERHTQQERDHSAQQAAALHRSYEERLDLERSTHQQQLAELRQQHEKRLSELTADSTRMAEQFEALSKRIMTDSTEHLIKQAKEQLRHHTELSAAELAQRELAIHKLVEPLSKTLDAVATHVDTAERSRLEAHGSLMEQIRATHEASDHLRRETAQLTTALRSSQVRGAWGELQLRRVVEAAGMLAHVDFVEQEHVSTDDGAIRPDMIVKLAGGKNVVVDAKVAFLGYLEAQEATDPAVRADRLAAHARHLKAHVDSLTSKRYWEQFAPTPEFVVMFVPAESFLSAALDQDPALLEYAIRGNVIIATPMTMIALLRTVAYAWRQEALAANALQVLALGKELHGRLATMGGHLAKLGRQLQSAADSYNRTVGSLETRVLVSARRFADLHVVDEDLASPGSVNPQLSVVTAPELIASATDAIVELETMPEVPPSAATR